MILEQTGDSMMGLIVEIDARETHVKVVLYDGVNRRPIYAQTGSDLSEAMENVVVQSGSNQMECGGFLGITRNAYKYIVFYFKPREVADRLSESPLERSFWATYINNKLRYPTLDGLVQQYQIDKYRCDYAIPRLKMIVELDGFTYHSTREAFNTDIARQRKLESMGWRIIRFTGDEVRTRVGSCLNDVVDFAQMISAPDTSEPGEPQ